MSLGVRLGFLCRTSRRLGRREPCRHYCNNKPPTVWKTVALPSRTVIRVSGAESDTFLQGLLTNDLNSLTEGTLSSMYCMFLNTGGRVLFDSIVTVGFEDKEFLLDVDSAVVKSAVKHISMYRLRRKITIEQMTNLNVSAMYHLELPSPSESSFKTRSHVVGSTFCDGGAQESHLAPFFLCHGERKVAPDPRNDLLGYRYIGPETSLPHSLIRVDAEETDMNEYTRHRFTVGVAEGQAEIIPAKALPLEYNLDYLHGVSFHKGCYLGQELTARTHHTGIIRKRIVPFALADSRPEDGPLKFDEDITLESGKSVGKVKAFKNGLGLCLLRLQEGFSANRLLCRGSLAVNVTKPAWWPQERPEKVDKADS